MQTITQEEIMKNWEYKNLEKPLVSIRCLTYNHGPYIAQTLDGFLMQRTTFPFEVIIHDDASTDDTAKIIKQYEEKFPLIVKPIYEEENMYSKGNGAITEIVNSHISGKYIAACEGDDYWIDEYKLQKQVDFLENNPDYGMCFTNFNIFYQEKAIFEYDLLTSKPEQFPSEYSLKEWILERRYVAPMTWVYEKTLMDSYQRLPSCDGTFVMFAHFLASTKVKCLKDETTSVYRSLPESASHSKNPKRYFARVKNLLEVQKMLIDRYQLPADLKEEVTEKFYKRAYKLIALVNDKEEIVEAKKYCKSLKSKVYFVLISIKPVRNILCALWKRK